MKKIVLLFISITVSVVIYGQTAAIKTYVDTYQEIAIKEMMRTGVPAAITLAQGILESQSGQSVLCQQSNNHFGIKCKDEWTGPFVLHDDDKKNECFRVYANAEESFRDHSDFLKNRPYYVDLFKLQPDDYKGWASGLKKAGYATERNYPQLLIKLIEDNNLQQYTLTAMQRMKNPVQEDYASTAPAANNQPTTNKPAAIAMQPQPADATENNNTAPVAVNNTNNTAANEDEDDDDDSTINKKVHNPADDLDGTIDAYPDGVFSINETKVVYAKAGTSLFALASNYNIAYKSLLTFNEMDKGDILAKDRLIYLEKKPKSGLKQYHIVTASETIEDIAQKEGVRLESILQYNTLQKGNQPATGTKIYLRLTPGTASRSHKA